MVTMQNRRSFIRAMMATAGAAAAYTPAIARALKIPADRRTGTLKDVGHVVILTQENRSFDHYFGTMRGVRGGVREVRRSGAFCGETAGTARRLNLTLLAIVSRIGAACQTDFDFPAERRPPLSHLSP